MYSAPSTCNASPSTAPSRRTEPKTDQRSGGFPHSEIPGSKGALASPGLIAECHVLHRLLPPRHPPGALLALDRDPVGGRRPKLPCGRLEGRSASGSAFPCDRMKDPVAVSILDLERRDAHPCPPGLRRSAMDASRVSLFTMSTRPTSRPAARKGPNE